MTLCTTFLRIIQSRCNQCTTCRIIISNNRMVSTLPNQQQQQTQRYYTRDNRDNGDNDNNVYKTSSLSMKQQKNRNNRPIYGNAIIIGSSGIVGTIMKQFLLQQLNMNVLGIDINDTNNDSNDYDSNSNYNTNTTSFDHTTDNQQPIYKFCQIQQPDVSSSSTKDKNPLTSYTHSIVRNVHDFLTNDDIQNPYIDVIIVASGGFEMDPTPYIPKQPRTSKNSTTVTTTDTTTTIIPNIDQIIHYSTLYTQTINNMYTKNLYPVIAASIVAQYYMNPNIIQSDNTHHDYDDNDIESSSAHMKGTLMVVFGAMAAIQSTPTMIGYGTAKNSIHYYIQSFATYTGGNSSISNDIYMNLKHISNPNLISNNNTGDGPIHNLQDSKIIRQTGRKVNQNLPNLDHLTIIAILPTMIDTPNNRQYLLTQQKDKSKQSDKTSDHDESKNEQLFASTLVSPHDIVKEIGIWITTPSLRPHTGALIKVIPSTVSKNNNNTNNNNNNKTNNTARFELVR